MYLSQLTARNFRQFGDGDAMLHIYFQPGVTALVGRNDSGKSAVIDAVRYALLTRDQEFIRVQPEDFHIDNAGNQASEIYILCKLADLTDAEKGALIEYLSYEGDDVILYVTWTARKLSETPGTRRWIDLSVRSGIDGAGPPFDTSVRELLSATYLRPLRDAEREMSPGRRSRLSQILSNVPEISEGESFDSANIPKDADAVGKLGLVGLSDYMRHNVKNHTGVGSAQDTINKQYLTSLSLSGDELQSKIDVSEGGTESARLRQILERLELGLLDSTTGNLMGRYGLGSNNLLFMACELLLLGKEPEGLPLLLIEEPEAHLHPQRQLRLMEFLQQAAEREIEGANRAVQVLLSTHSPNLASKIPLTNLVLLQGRQAFPLAKDHTLLETGDYSFLERFLDVTKANLFFAQGVLIVEGVAEAIILPTLAKLIGNDLTEHGVSIVNVGGTGLRRFSRIFQRKEEGAQRIGVPVACLADIDVMPDCAPKILGLVEGDNDVKWQNSKRRWKAVRDFGDNAEQCKNGLVELRDRLKKNDGQGVRTFVADHWTLEYDLARSGLAELVYVAACLAKNENSLNEEKKNREDVVAEAKTRFSTLKSCSGDDDEVLCSLIYRLFHSGSASKAVAVQHLSELLTQYCENGGINAAGFRKLLPTYLVNAIDYATAQLPQQASEPASIDGGEDV
ncbi:MAG: AAA family ATPase [Halieaceae bacterium]|nr:AAA family ATPase [Halieaceae bacterium]